MDWRSLVVVTVVVSLLPAGSATAAPAEDEIEAPGAPAEGPAEAPLAAPVTSAPPPAAAVEPKHSGKGLLGAAIGLTALSWVSRFSAIGLMASAEGCSESGCDGRYTAGIALLYTAPVSQLVATGLVIPGGVLKGRHDGWRNVTTGKPQRDGTTFVIAGGVTFGVFTALSIALRPLYVYSLFGCAVENLDGSGSDCGGIGSVVGFHVGMAVSDAGSTAGAGLMSYGLGYRGHTRRHGQLSVAPFGSHGAYGLSIGGRF